MGLIDLYAIFVGFLNTKPLIGGGEIHERTHPMLFRDIPQKYLSEMLHTVIFRKPNCGVIGVNVVNGINNLPLSKTADGICDLALKYDIPRKVSIEIDIQTCYWSIWKDFYRVTWMCDIPDDWPNGKLNWITPKEYVRLVPHDTEMLLYFDLI